MALDHAFEEPVAPPYSKTKAIVVVHAGTGVVDENGQVSASVDFTSRAHQSFQPVATPILV
jgi:hypothetical protein